MASRSTSRPGSTRLYETIDAFAGTVDDRMRTFASRVEGAFAEPAAPSQPPTDDAKQP